MDPEPIVEGGEQSIELDACSELEWFVVRTRRSLYDVIVIEGETGDVMLRGGHFVSGFRRATIGGSFFGGGDVKPGSICAGYRLEFCLDGKSFVTSRIESVSRRGRLQSILARKAAASTLSQRTPAYGHDAIVQ
jgi:hypothetical protein